MSAQSYPVPALANTFTLFGSNSINSASQLPISPPLPQCGLMTAWKSPHLPSLNARANSSRCRSSADGRTTSHCETRLRYASGLYLTGSPMCSTRGLVPGLPPVSGEGRMGRETGW